MSAGHIRDTRELLGMRSRAAVFVVGVYLAGLTAVVVWMATDVAAGWRVLLAGVVAGVGSVVLFTAGGDPLPWRFTVPVALSGPASCALVLSTIRDTSGGVLQAWPFNAGTAICILLCTRGRTGTAWVAMALMTVVRVVWSSATGQDIGHAVAVSVINSAPLVMATVFAHLIRPAAEEVFELRDQSTRQIAERAAATAMLDERDKQLRRLDRLGRPLLERIATGIELSDNEALHCRLVEAQLRDRVRAPGLDTAPVVAAVRAARMRGAEVVLLDDHGFDQVAEVVRERLLDVVVGHLADVRTGRATIRILPPGRPVVLSVLVSDTDRAERAEYGHDGHPLGIGGPAPLGGFGSEPVCHRSGHCPGE